MWQKPILVIGFLLSGAKEMSVQATTGACFDRGGESPMPGAQASRFAGR